MRPSVHVVAAVLRNASAQILIQQRPANKEMAGYWEFPGGKSHAGESHWEALVRELREELDIVALTGQPLILLSHDYPERRIVLDVWDVASWQGTPKSMEGQRLLWLDAKDLASKKFLPADKPVLMALQ